MTDYKTIQYEMLYTASLNAKKALKEGNEILEFVSDCVLETDINNSESVMKNLEYILSFNENVWYKTEYAERSIDALMYMHDMIIEDYKTDIELLKEQINVLFLRYTA